MREKDFSKTETKNNICINVFCYENRLTFPIYISNQKIENSMDLLLVTIENKSHYVYIKDFDKFMFHKKERIKTKNTFARVVYSVLVVKMCWQSIKKVCLSINGAQSVRLEKVTIKFKNYFKEIPVPFKIHADFEYNLESVESYGGSYSKKISRSRFL